MTIIYGILSFIKRGYINVCSGISIFNEQTLKIKTNSCLNNVYVDFEETIQCALNVVILSHSNVKGCRFHLGL